MANRVSIETLPQSELQGRIVLVRADFNVPLVETVHGVAIGDLTRVRATLPTISFLSKNGARTVLCSHLGRPRGHLEPGLSLRPVAEALSASSDGIGLQVQFVEECVGPRAQSAINSLSDGDILLLENLRFHREETDNDDRFAQQLAEGAAIFVNDAFGSSHRAHASIVGVAKYIPRRYAGTLMHKELAFLGGALQNGEGPLAAVVGGAKVSTKLGILRNLLDRVDKLVVGGGMVYTFYRALGNSLGDSVAEEELVAQADEIMKTAEQRGCSLVLAVDSHIVATEQLRGKALRTAATYLPKRAAMLPGVHAAGLGKGESVQTEALAEVTLYVSPAEAGHFVLNEAIPSGYTAVDIGTKSIENFCKELEPCRTVLWNGPMGICERDEYARGTTAVMRYLSDLTAWGATTIVCGGETVAAVEREQHNIQLVQDDLRARLGGQAAELQGIRKLVYSHVSTGGGAALEFLEGKELPGVGVLDNAVTDVMTK